MCISCNFLYMGIINVLTYFNFYFHINKTYTDKYFLE